MRSLNKVILVGNLTRDPEMRKTTTDQYIATFGLATNREWSTKRASGESERHSSAEFHELVCWGRLAEIASERLKKGNMIYIEGYLKTRSWDGDNGTKKFRTEVVVEDLIILEKKPREESDAQPTIIVEDPFTI